MDPLGGSEGRAGRSGLPLGNGLGASIKASGCGSGGQPYFVDACWHATGSIPTHNCTILLRGTS